MGWRHCHHPILLILLVLDGLLRGFELQKNPHRSLTMSDGAWPCELCGTHSLPFSRVAPFESTDEDHPSYNGEEEDDAGASDWYTASQVSEVTSLYFGNYLNMRPRGCPLMRPSDAPL